MIAYMYDKNTLQIADANNYAAEGRLWAHGGEEAMLRVIEFAGLPVTEEGLAVSPPSGGVLTVWPDGRYEYVPPIHEGSLDAQEAVSTFFGYVAEDLYGEIVAGSIMLASGEDSLDPMQDFQAWSLPELIDGAVDSLLNGAAPELLEYFASNAPDHADHVESMSLAEHGSELDDLTRLILDSQNS